MKNIVLIIIGATGILYISSCTKNTNCNTTSPCQERPPQDEACAAHFQRWFFDNNSKKCELINYSGCSTKGFATEEECNQCECNANK